MNDITSCDSKIIIKNESDVKRLISQLHREIRDLDSSSNIVERFDELSKLLFVKICNSDAFELGANSRERTNSIRKAYKDLSSSFAQEAPEAFQEIKLSNDSIISLADLISKWAFPKTSFDLKGIAYEEMIKDTFEKGDNQQYFTPGSVVNFMCRAMQKFSQGLVCDPASGTGGFLIQLLKEGGGFNKLLALEIDQRLAWVSSLNLKLHGAEKFESKYLRQGGSLGDEANPYFGAVDLILTNPPFGSDFSDPIGLRKFELGKGKVSRRRGVLFIERCLSLLKEGGWLAIIIDDSVLNSPSNQDVRELILSKAEVRGVVSLPSTAFMPYATVQASILLLKKSATGNSGVSTFFAKSENIGKKPNGEVDFTYSAEGKELLNNDLDEILKNWEAYLEGGKVLQSENCYIASMADSFFNAENTHSSRIDFPYHHPARKLVKEAVSKHGEKLLKISDICNEVKATLVPAKDTPDDRILYTGLAQIDSNSEVYRQVEVPAKTLKSTVKSYEVGDVLFSKMRPELRKCVAIDGEKGGYCSSECVVYRIKDKYAESITPKILAAALRSDFFYGQIVHLVAGIGRPRVSPKELKNIMLPISTPEDLLSVEREYNKNLGTIRDLEEKAEELMKKSKELRGSLADKVINLMLEG